jgi:hypothetical protein
MASPAWRNDEMVGELLAEYGRLGIGYYAITRSQDPLGIAEDVLGRAVEPLPDRRADHRVAYGAVWGELVSTIKKLRDRGVPIQVLVQERGQLSRSDVDRLTSEATTPTAGSIAQDWSISSLTQQVTYQLHKLDQAGRTAEAESLREVARPFLRVWADQTVPEDPPSQDTFFQERHYKLAPRNP